MKNNRCFPLSFFFLLFSFLSFGQSENIYIPYKSGEYWGMADTNGVVLIQPRFEKIDHIGEIFFKASKEPCNYHFSCETLGLLDRNDSLLLNYKYIYIKIKDGFIIGRPYKKSKEKIIDVFDTNLNPIFKNEISGFQKIDSNLYIVKDNKKAGIVKFKPGTTEIDSWIFERVYDRITFENKNVKTYLNDSIQIYSIASLKKPIILTDSVQLFSEEEEEPVFLDVPSNSFATKENEKKKPAPLSKKKYSLLREGDYKNRILVLKKEHYYIKERRKVNITPIEYDTLGNDFKEIEIKFLYSLPFTKRDSLFKQRGIERYDMAIVTNKNGLKGYFDGFGHQLLPEEYDDISRWPILIRLKESKSNFYDTKYYMCKKNNKYGIVDENNKIILNFEFEEILMKNRKVNFQSPKDKIITKKNGKFGIVDFQNMNILKYEMDSISYTFTGDPYQPGFLLKKDNLYGLLTHDNEFIFPQYPYEPRNIKMIKEFFLIEMIDKKGTFLGYADKKGTLYFEEKKE